MKAEVEIIDYEPHCKEHGLMTKTHIVWTCDSCDAKVTEITTHV